jgi:hypothetical protein
MKTFEYITLAKLCNFFHEAMHQKMGIPTFPFNFFVKKAREPGSFMPLLWHSVGVYMCTLDRYFAAIVMTLQDLQDEKRSKMFFLTLHFFDLVWPLACQQGHTQLFY